MVKINQLIILEVVEIINMLQGCPKGFRTWLGLSQIFIPPTPLHTLKRLHHALYTTQNFFIAYQSFLSQIPVLSNIGSE